MAVNSLSKTIAAISTVLFGKEQPIRLALCCLVAGGHLLLEDLPGMGKTTLAESLARCLGLDFRRVHFTSDLLPADLTGIGVLEPKSGVFRFQPGPLFSQVLLADEINRASPRTQSALLEAMGSGHTSVDGVTHSLPQPFFVIASQNGLDHQGTHPLPESQLDRFMMRLSLGFPDRQAEAQMLLGLSNPVEALPAQLSACQLLEVQAAAAATHVSSELIAYVVDLLAASRQLAVSGRCAPLSPRAGLALLAAAKAWAFIESAPYVNPNHVQAVFGAVCDHRLDGGHAQTELSQALLEQVDGIR